MKITHALTFLFIIGCLVVENQVASACICTADFSPVCATNGQTYSNICRMTCVGAKLKHRGSCGQGNV